MIRRPTSSTSTIFRSLAGRGCSGSGANRRAVRIMTAHEHWLICPMHLLWKYDRKACESPNCVSCCLNGRRPPQVWRATRAIERGLHSLDALVFPAGIAWKSIAGAVSART